MILVRSIAELDLPRGGVVGLVPTMGALHEGHAALFRAARAECDVLVASVFVNPAQFTDAARSRLRIRAISTPMPRRRAQTASTCSSRRRSRRCTAGFATWVDPAGAADALEGVQRPGHFRGVATVCVKLFNIVKPQRAWFGRKDAQQVAVLKQVVRDLNLDVEIRVVDTVRDADGLALSSRNAALSASERVQARAIPRALATRDPEAARGCSPRQASSPSTSRRRSRRPHSRHRSHRRNDAADRQHPAQGRSNT